MQGDGCVAADLNGDGRTDLVVTTTNGVDILWNDGRHVPRRAALPANGWYTGAAVADVNGDGRPDLFVAGYSDPNDPVAELARGLPDEHRGRPRPALPERGGGTVPRGRRRRQASRRARSGTGSARSSWT